MLYITQQGMQKIEVHGLKLKKVDYIQISHEAKVKIIELLQNKKQAESDILGVLINLNQKGCAGLAYKIEYAKKDINLFDGYELIHFEEFDIFINPKIALYLIGTHMEYKNDILKSGFVFENPNSKGSCGCGESFFV